MELNYCELIRITAWEAVTGVSPLLTVPVRGCGCVLASISSFGGEYYPARVVKPTLQRRKGSFARTTVLPPRAACSSTFHSRCFAGHHVPSWASSLLVPNQLVGWRVHLHRKEQGIRSRLTRPIPILGCDVQCRLAGSRACEGRASECRTQPERTTCPSRSAPCPSHMD